MSSVSASDKNLSFEQSRWEAWKTLQAGQNSTNSFGTSISAEPSSAMDISFNSSETSDPFDFGTSASTGSSVGKDFDFGTTTNKEVAKKASDPFDFCTSSSTGSSVGNDFDFGTTTNKEVAKKASDPFDFGTSSSTGSSVGNDFDFGTTANKNAVKKASDPFVTDKDPFATMDVSFDSKSKSNQSFQSAPSNFDFGAPAFGTPSVSKPSIKVNDVGAAVRKSAQCPTTPTNSNSQPGVETPTFKKLDELQKVSHIMQIASSLIKEQGINDNQNYSVSNKSRSLYPRRLKRRSRRLSLSSRRLLSPNRSSTTTKYRTPTKLSYLRTRRSFASPYSGWSMQKSIRVR